MIFGAKITIQNSRKISIELTFPNAPINPIVLSVDENSALVGWGAVDGVSGYNVYKGDTKLNTELVTDTQYNVTGLSSNTNINDIFIASVDDQNNESPNPLQIPNFITLPSQVSNVTAIVNSSNEISLSWDAVPGDATVTYNVVRGTTTGILSPVDIGRSTPSFLDSVNPSTQYFYAVEAENATGKGVLSTEVSGTTPSSVTAPTQVTLSNSSIAENNAVNALIGTFNSDGTEPKTYTLSGTDADSFSIANTNELRADISFDFETKASYSITVTATNSAGSFAQNFTITISNIDEGLLSARELNTIPINTVSNGVEMNPYGYLEYKPEGYEQFNDWNVLIWYPGGGETGDGSEANVNTLRSGNQIGSYLNAGNEFPTIVLMPISPFGQFTGSGNAGRDFFLWAYTKYLSKSNGKFHIEALSGSGAFPTKWLQNGDPDFEKVATLTLCAPDTIPSEPYFTNLVAAKTRVWYHHATNDSLVGITARRNSYNLIHNVYPKTNYSRYRFTEYTSGGHSGAWTRVYNNSGSTATKVTGSMPVSNSFLEYYNWVTPETWSSWLMEDTAATDIILSSQSINESEPVNTVVAEITSDKLNPDVYTLVNGFGDNASFNISGTRTQSFLRTSEVFDSGVKSGYNIRLETFDGFTKDFTITVNEIIADAPVNTVAPSISGIPAINEILTVVPGQYTGTEPINKTYQWFKDGVAITDEDGLTYSVLPIDEDSDIYFEEYAENIQATITTQSNTVTITAEAEPETAFTEINFGFEDATFESGDNGANFVSGVNKGTSNHSSTVGIYNSSPPTLDVAEQAIRFTRANSNALTIARTANLNAPYTWGIVLKLPASSSIRHLFGFSPTKSFRLGGNDSINVNNSTLDPVQFFPEGSYLAFRLVLGTATTQSFIQFNKDAKIPIAIEEGGINFTGDTFIGDRGDNNNSAEMLLRWIGLESGEILDAEWDAIVDKYIV